ncbi:MAG: hypothetical protein ACRDT6_26510 [Micromonosporaceae bacterium]
MHWFNRALWTLVGLLLVGFGGFGVAMHLGLGDGRLGALRRESALLAEPVLVAWRSGGPWAWLVVGFAGLLLAGLGAGLLAGRLRRRAPAPVGEINYRPAHAADELPELAAVAMPEPGVAEVGTAGPAEPEPSATAEPHAADEPSSADEPSAADGPSAADEPSAPAVAASNLAAGEVTAPSMTAPSEAPAPGARESELVPSEAAGDEEWPPPYQPSPRWRRLDEAMPGRHRAMPGAELLAPEPHTGNGATRAPAAALAHQVEHDLTQHKDIRDAAVRLTGRAERPVLHATLDVTGGANLDDVAGHVADAVRRLSRTSGRTVAGVEVVVRLSGDPARTL